jgi:iron transport multicopper oxidase
VALLIQQALAYFESAFFNGITYVPPKVPTLYSVLSTGASASNPEIYGVNTNAFVLKADEVVEIVVNNVDTGRHPLHLHGHAFQTVVRSAEEAGIYNGSGSVELPAIPMRRDTFMVRPRGNIVLRFTASNPDKSIVPRCLPSYLHSRFTRLAFPLPH